MLRIYYLKISDWNDYTNSYFFSQVSEETVKLVDSYRNEKIQRTKLLGETMTRQLLQSVFGLNKKDFIILKGEHGKPFVSMQASPVFFSLSHSGNYIICAISEQEVGVDIERIGKVRMEVARRFFHPEEISQLENLSDDLQTDLFFRLWSAKESFLKYTGSGLSSPLSGFEVRFDANVIRIFRDHHLQSLTLKECVINKEYKCFVCTQTEEEPEISAFRFSNIV